MTPIDSPTLFGRDALVAQVHDALQKERVVMLVGPPGVGKSAIARAVVHHVNARGTRRTCWVRLVGVSERDRALALIRHALSGLVEGDAEPRSLEEMLSRLPNLWLVLDGAEDCLDALAAVWSAWWRVSAVDSLTVLVTTRRDPRLINARLVTIPPLRTAREPAEELAPALAWFFHCAHNRAWRLDVSDAHTLQQVERIVSHLGGNATAIELAASRGKLMGLAQLLQYVQRDLSILEGRLFDVSSRQKNFVHMLAQSWSALDETDRATLALCSTFDLPFRVEALATLADLSLPEAFDRIEALVERGLLRARLQRDVVVFDVIGVMRQFVEGTEAYRALSSRIRAHARTISLQTARELFERGDASDVELDEDQIEAWLELAQQEQEIDVSSMLLSLVFRHARALPPLYRAYELVVTRPALHVRFALLCLARRVEMLYVEPGAESALDSRPPSRQEFALDVLDPLSPREADPHGAELWRASLLMQAGQHDEAGRLLDELRRGWGVRKDGVRSGQLDLLTMEHMVRTRRLPLAKRLVRTRYIAMRGRPGAPLWDEFVSAALLLELLGALEQPTLEPRRVKMTWHASGIDLEDASWRDPRIQGRYMRALSRLLDWVSDLPEREATGEEYSTRQARLVELFVWMLEARSERARPDMSHFHTLASVWREIRADQLDWFELLVSEGIEMCLRHERLHSVALQLHGSGTLVTIDMQRHRFRVGDAQWVSFGHRPKAKLLIEYMVRQNERGEFVEVQADELIGHIWPDESMRYDSALARLYNLIANLRRLGLSDVLVRQKEGYRLSDECVVQVLPARE